MITLTLCFRFAGALLLAAAFASPLVAADKKVLLIAGAPSHGPGHHEHNAGVLLLQKALSGVKGLRVDVALNGWPKDPRAFDGVSGILIYSDGGARHPALQENRLVELDRVLSKGVGLALIHFATEPTKEKGQREFIRWVGGAFETNWSVNPHWTANFASIPAHPVTRGVKPFSLRDEWYFNLRFIEGMRGVTPLLAAVPDASTVTRPDGAHSGNPTVRRLVARGVPQIVSWAYEREGGGRGFGTTGGHYHTNWGQPDFRKMVLNAILWIAQIDVPVDGFESVITAEDLAQNLDPKPAAKTKSARPAPAAPTATTK